jgi:hypothetical protein
MMRALRFIGLYGDKVALFDDETRSWSVLSTSPKEHEGEISGEAGFIGGKFFCYWRETDGEVKAYIDGKIYSSSEPDFEVILRTVDNRCAPYEFELLVLNLRTGEFVSKTRYISGSITFGYYDPIYTLTEQEQDEPALGFYDVYTRARTAAGYRVSLDRICDTIKRYISIRH